MVMSNVGFSPFWFRSGLNSSSSLAAPSPVYSKIFGLARVGVNTFFARRVASVFFSAIFLWRKMQLAVSLLLISISPSQMSKHA